MGWNVIRAILRRELLSYFTTPLGYIFITIFLIATAYLNFSFEDRFFASNIADLTPLNLTIPFLLMAYIPTIAMGVWANERNSGTDALLLTLPVRDQDVVIGKYLALLAIYTASLVFSLANVIVLLSLGNPDLGLIVSNYLGYWLAGAALLPVAMIGSLLTRNASIAMVLGFLLCALLVWIPGRIFGAHQIGIPYRMEGFSEGKIELNNVMYFVAIAASAIYLNIVLLSKRHWTGGKNGASMWYHFLVRGVSVVLAAVCLTLIWDRFPARIDVTVERLHSLSGVTEKVVSSLNEREEGQAVLIEAFVSPNVPREFEEQKREFLTKLRSVKSRSADRIRLIVNEVEVYSEEADRAKNLYGIEPTKVADYDSGTASAVDIFLGFAVRFGTNQQVVPFLSTGLSPEYELTRSINTVLGEKRKTVGIVKTKIQLFESYDRQQRIPENWLVTELKKQYIVKEVNLQPATPDEDVTIPDDVDALICPMVSILEPEALENLREYVLAGKPALLMDDPLTDFDQSLVQSIGMTPPPHVTDFYSAIGAKVDTENVVWDGFNPHPKILGNAPMARLIVFPHRESGSPAPFDQNEAATKDLREIVTILGSRVSLAGVHSLEMTPLVNSSLQSGTVAKNKLYGQLQDSDLVVADTRNGQPLAARIRGKFSDKDTNANFILVGDVDMFMNPYVAQLYNWGDRELQLDNIQFLLNCVDALTGQDALIELRSRRAARRTLTAVAEAKRVFEAESKAVADEARKEEERLKKEATDAFEAEIKTVQERSDLTPVQRAQRAAELRRTREVEKRQREREIEQQRDRKIEESRRKERQEVRELEKSFQLSATFLPPLPPLIVLILVFIARMKRERTLREERRQL